jgi:hypothetical protein
MSLEILTDERKFSPEQWNKQYNDKIIVSAVAPSEEVPQSTLRVPSWLKQIQLYGLRDFLAKLSNTQYLVINLLEAPLLAFNPGLYCALLQHR